MYLHVQLELISICEMYFKSSVCILPAGILPRSWCRYTVPASMTVIQWVADFSERIKQLQQISQAAASGGAKELKVSAHTHVTTDSPQ